MMKNKVINIILTLFICFLAAPILLYLIIGTSYFQYMIYLIPKKLILSMYFTITTLGFILYILWKFLKNFILYKLNKSPIIKSELISIEKLNQKSLSLGFIEIGIEAEEAYMVKFKHRNKIIDTIIPKDDVEKDLPTDESPYVEYQYVRFINFFHKFKNIKVHTNKK